MQKKFAAARRQQLCAPRTEEDTEYLDGLKVSLREAKAQGAWASENRVATAEDEERGACSSQHCTEAKQR